MKYLLLFCLVSCSTAQAQNPNKSQEFTVDSLHCDWCVGTNEIQDPNKSQESIQYTVDHLYCAWSSKYKACFCGFRSINVEGYPLFPSLTWVPDTVCLLRNTTFAKEGGK